MAWIGILLSILLVLLLGFLWRRRPEDLRPEGLRSLYPLSEQGRWVSVDGVRLHYIESGTGPALLLLHGYCSSTYSWREVFEPLSRRFRVVAIDLKGFGLSEKPPGDYRLEAQAELVAHFIQALGLEPVVLIGNSMGGSIALAVALHHPALVRGLVLVDSAAFTLSRVLRALRAVSWPGVRELIGASLLIHSRRVVQHSLSRCYYDPSQVTDVQRAVYRAPLVTRRGGLAAHRAGLAFDTTKILPHLDRIAHPTLIVWGAADRIIPVENAHRLHARLPNARLVVLERAGHIPQEETPRPFLDAVIPFLLEITQASAPARTVKSHEA